MVVLKISYVIIYGKRGFVKRKVGIFQEFFGNANPEVMVMRKWKLPVLFAIGGLGYVGLELFWRGRSHGSMFLAGGSCFLLLGWLRKKLPRLSLPGRALLGAGVITWVELLTGFVFNRSYQVWDYRNMPVNLLGQICLPFSLLWLPVSLGAMALYGWLDRILSKDYKTGRA